MAATKDDLRRWFAQGKVSSESIHGYGYMVIVCDMFSWEDHPIYVTSKQDAQAIIDSRGAMEKVMEVYDLDMDMDIQLSEYRAWHL